MKRKTLSKLMAASMAAVMTVGMTGCGGGAANTDQTDDAAQTDTTDTADTADTTDTADAADTTDTADAETEAADDGTPEIKIDPATGEPFDLGGMDIIIADWWTDPNTEPTTEFQEAQKEYRDWLQETYNFTMVQKNYAGWGWGEGSIGEAFVQAATSGSDENIIYILTNSASTASYVSQGLCYDISKLDGDVVDLSREKWTCNGELDSWSVGDAKYGFYAGPSEPRGGLYFNKTVLKDAGIDPESIYDMQADGTWTWDAWIDIMSKVQRDIDNDGQIDVYGCVQNNGGMVMQCIRSNGGALVTKNADGTYELTADSDAVREGLHFALDEVTSKYYLNYSNEDGSNWEDYKVRFMNGEAAFMFDDAYCAYQGGWLTGQSVDADGNPTAVNGTALTQQVDYGFVMFPKGPRMDDYVTNKSNNVTMMPSSYSDEKARLLMFAYDVWTDDVPGEEWEGYYGLLDNLYGGMRDTRSVDETIDMMTTRGVDDVHAIVPNFNPNDNFLYQAGVGADADALLEQNLAEWQTAVDEFNASLKQ